MNIQFEGKAIELKPLTINQLVEIEDKFGSLSKLKDSGEVPMKLVRYVAFVCLKKHIPDITEERVGEVLDIGTLTEMMKLINPDPKEPNSRPT